MASTFSTFYGGEHPNGININITGTLDSSKYTGDISTNELTKVEIGTAVTFISRQAFDNRGIDSKLTEVIISNNVTTIGDRSFRGNENLETLHLGSGVTSILERAFQNCFKLTSVIIPASVTSIGPYVFVNDNSLNDVTFEDGNNISIINTNSFPDVSNNSNSVIHFNKPGRIESITNNNLQTIATNKYANQTFSTVFYGGLYPTGIGKDISGTLDSSDYTNDISTNQLTKVEIGTYVTEISNNAFQDASNLTQVFISDNVTTIGDNAFSQCGLLSSVIIPDNTTSIGDNAFYECTNLATLDLGSGVVTIGDNAFYQCGLLSSVIIPDSTTSIGYNAFQNCSALATVIISDVSGITTISSNSFTDLSGTDSYSGSTITFTGYDSFIELDNIWIDNGLQSTWDAITSYFETQNPQRQIDPTLSNFSIPTLNITNTEPYTIIPPESNSSGTFTYDSSNTNIAEISGNTIISENKTAGETTITATQEESRYYFTGSISAPVTNICFLAGTPVTTDQGNIPIEKINPKIHTIRNKKIVCITQTITQDKHLICFEKNSLGKNIPSQQTIITRNHRIFYKGKMIKACKFTGIKNVYEIKYNGEFLYNVLMEEHDKMIVNNFICETLDPENDIANLYVCFENKTKKQIEQMIQCYNKNIIKKKIFSKR